MSLRFPTKVNQELKPLAVVPFSISCSYVQFSGTTEMKNISFHFYPKKISHHVDNNLNMNQTKFVACVYLQNDILFSSFPTISGEPSASKEEKGIWGHKRRNHRCNPMYLSKATSTCWPM